MLSSVSCSLCTFSLLPSDTRRSGWADSRISLEQPAVIQMARRTFTLLTWNINGLRARFPNLHAYVATNKPDVISLQEVGPDILPLRGYDSYCLECGAGSSRGLVTYVRQGLPVTLKETGARHGVEYIILSLNFHNEPILLANLYVHAGSFRISHLPECILEDKCVLMGDMNARHVELGSHHTSNANGVRWKRFLDSTPTVMLTGDNVPTHVQGGRLDYVAFLNFSDLTAETHLLSDLLSDHFALATTFPITSFPFSRRPRLTVPPSSLPSLAACVGNWYAVARGTFADPTCLYQGLLRTIEGFVHQCGVPRTKGPHTGARVTYDRDPLISNCKKTLAIYQRRWQQNPADAEARHAMVTVARHLTELRQQLRREYWDSFLSVIRKTNTLTGIWHHVNRVRGRVRTHVSDSDPAAKAGELLRTWTRASALDGLPDAHRDSLEHHRPYRMDIISFNEMLFDDTCLPFTRDELLCAVKRGKSTAPGRDGLTYDIINNLLPLSDNPILDLFNMSYESGTLPPLWKTADIIPVPKGDGTYRPISLTSCLCKFMERMVLRRLLYKLGDQMSPNLHGFMKGRSSSDCFIKGLSAVGVTCRAFIDLKGAFDRANPEVILEELVLKGVKGKLLQWLHSYLNDRKARVWFQGATSAEGSFDLGTPQGGVLSPMLFNVLMDKLARTDFPPGTEVIIYADDILLQCDAPRTLTLALRHLESLCVQMGLVINGSKTKFQTSLRICRPPVINNVPLERVQCYKYLGAQLSFKKSPVCIDYIYNQCLLRLAPLRVLAHRGLGVGIPVLRLFYISVIRSLIDYAAPVLLQYNLSQLKPLELIQNEAMRTILGCPRTARIEVLRAELGLPSVARRIQDVTCRALCRMARNGVTRPLCSLAALHLNPATPATSYLRRLLKLLTQCGVLQEYFNIVISPPSPSWRPHRINVDVEQLPKPKHDWLPQELLAHFMEKLSPLSRDRTVHIYCDGSVDGSKSGCGLFIRDYTTPTVYTDTLVSRRLPDHLSSTRAELYAILEGLQIVASSGKDVIFFVDSQAALYALSSASPLDCDLVNKCISILNSIEQASFTVHFIWIPSHVGIPFNDQADVLARKAITCSVGDPLPAESTYCHLRKKIQHYARSSIAADIACRYGQGSPSAIHYVQVANSADVTYGQLSGKCDLVSMRLRLGYRYYWEVSGSEAVPCALCGAAAGHTLTHYVLDCPLIASFRPQGQWDLPSMVTWFLNKGLIPDILKEHPQFAPRW